MITFNQVSKCYAGGYEALGCLDLVVETGEMAFITGHSGAGKSTLLKLIALLERPSTGQIIVDGQSLRQFKARDIARFRSTLGLIFQSPSLLSHATVFDNVALPLQVQGVPHKTIQKRVHAALDRVGLLNKEKIIPIHLSGGEQQRVGIARAIVHKPNILLADEPTGNLDPGLSAEVMALFRQLNEVGVSVLVATHDLALIAGLKYRIIRLKGGRLC